MAELKFNKPDQMEIDTPYTVSATIAGALAEAQATLGNVGPTVSRAVKITRKVRVELIADDFDIKKLSAVDTVLITPETSGQWSLAGHAAPPWRRAQDAAAGLWRDRKRWRRAGRNADQDL
ncbi:MAG: hypothetical protein WDN76_01205 [Alphaproteobacteria bacterium]